MKIKFSHIRRLVLFATLAILIFMGGYFTREQWKISFGQEPYGVGLKEKGWGIKFSRELPLDKQNLNFALFWEVWDKLERDYAVKDKIDRQAMIYGAIKGMVGALGDPYTVFLPPGDQKRSREDLSGSFEGVGIEIGFKGTQLAVISPLSGTPADRAGLKAGDFILFITDEKRGIEKGTAGIDLIDAVNSIRGPVGTEVILKIAREGEEKPFDVTVTRAKIDVKSVELSFVGDPSASSGQVIANLKLLRFGEGTMKEWNTAVSDILEKKGAEGIVLDLRNNPGGFLNGAVVFASEFIKEGDMVIQEDGKGNRTVLPATGRGRLTKFPLVVLVNKGSASASEIVAGAIKDHKKGKIIGETTFGKGTIQEAQELAGGAGLHITTAKWLTPGGTWINEKGLEPDIKVTDKEDTEGDEQLQRAIEEVVK